MEDKIIELLRDLALDLEQPDPYRSPLSEISDFGDQATPMLIKSLQHDSPLIRRTSAVALGLLRSPIHDSLDLTPAVPRLEQVLVADPDPTVRMEAAEALWHICEHAAALQAFFRGLSHEDVEFRRWGATMLHLVGENEADAIPPLIEALDDPDLQVLRHAAEALAMHGAATATALPKLEVMLDKDEWTRVIGVESILTIDSSRAEELAPVLANALRSRSRRIRRRAVEALDTLPTVAALAVPELIEATADEDEPMRWAVLGCLEKSGSAAAPAIPTLVRILQGDGPDGGDTLVRGLAADALGAIGEKAQEAAYYLLECLQEPGDDTETTYFHLQVARALWMIEGEPEHTLTRAVPLLQHPSCRMRARAAWLLGELGVVACAAIPNLKQTLEDEHPFVRRYAAGALEKIAPDA